MTFSVWIFNCCVKVGVIHVPINNIFRISSIHSFLEFIISKVLVTRKKVGTFSMFERYQFTARSTF